MQPQRKKRKAWCNRSAITSSNTAQKSPPWKYCTAAPTASASPSRCLKELEKTLRDNHAAWTEDNLWNAFSVAAPGKVRGRSQAGRFADLVALVRFSLEQQSILAPFADSVSERFNEWLMDKAKTGVAFQPEQLAWLDLIRAHIATSLNIEPGDFDYAPFSQHGGRLAKRISFLEASCQHYWRNSTQY